MKIKLHTGFRAAQAGLAAAPKLPKALKTSTLGKSAAGKPFAAAKGKVLQPFGGKQAPPFQKKGYSA